MEKIKPRARKLKDKKRLSFRISKEKLERIEKQAIRLDQGKYDLIEAMIDASLKELEEE